MPNNVRSFFQECTWTERNGTTTFHAVPAGRRPIDVTLPAGFSAGPDGLTRDVDVVKDMESRVEFTVRRQ